MSSLTVNRLYAPTIVVTDEKAKVDCRAIVFHHPDVQEIAVELCAQYPHDMRLGNISWGSFPDGWPNIKFEPQDNIMNRNVLFVMSAHKLERCLEQLCLLIALCRQFARSMTIIIPYFGPATMERVVNEGELATAEPMLKLLSGTLPQTSGGLPALVLVDLHDIRERFYPTDNVTPRMLSAAELILPIIRREKLTIVFPDEGAYKRFGNLTDGLPVLTCIKRRDGANREVILGSSYNMDAYGDDVDTRTSFLIWDDLVHSGGTLIECAKALHCHTNASAVVQAFVTHAVFENNGYSRFLDVKDSGISRFYVTNSIPEVSRKLDQHRDVFSVLDITPCLAPFILQRIRGSPQKQAATAGHTITYVSSVSEIKIGAVRNAFKRKALHILGPQGVPCPSGVPEQPWGEEETRRGLYNRHTELRRLVLKQDLGIPPQMYLISIENGLIPVGDELQDVAMVLIEYFKEGTHWISEEATLCGKVPQEEITACRLAHDLDNNLTFGKYLQGSEQLNADVNPSDWAMSHGGSEKTRAETLANCIEAMLPI